MKKLLLVAVSVGVFLMVTIIAALTLITPSGQTQESAYYSSVPVSSGRVQPASEIMNNIPQLPSAAVETPETAAVRDNGESLTIQITRPASAAVPDTAAPAARPAAAPAAAAPAARTPAQPAATRAPAQPAATRTPAQPAATRAPAQPAAARPAASRTINDYWIQIGAYSAIIRAEDVKENLAAKGLISIIENRIINGQNLYRVRLGPYTSEREANHWLAIVKNIDGFQESQVRQTVRQQ